MLKNNLSGEFDAAVWAEEWLKTIKEKPEIATDYGTMIGWFANAIMAGYDRAYQEMEEKNWMGASTKKPDTS